MPLWGRIRTLPTTDGFTRRSRTRYTNHLFPRDRTRALPGHTFDLQFRVDAKALKARVAFGLPDNEALEPPENALERRYALRTVKQRLHQASFREAVITAYNGRCALSGLPEPLLLDAAHIVTDKDECGLSVQSTLVAPGGKPAVNRFPWR